MNAPAEILKDSEANLELAEKGFVVIDYIDSDKVAQLTQHLQDLLPSTPDHFFSTTHSPDTAFRKRANGYIQSVLEPAHSNHLKEGKPLGGAFIAKPKGPKGILPLHQDWNIVDEVLHRSYNVWIPLVDTHAYNGAVYVLEGSHNKILTYRGPNIPSSISNIAEHSFPHMKPLYMKAGQALIYDHALWHTSPANETDQLRPAVVLGMIHKEASLRFYFKEEDRIAEYEGYPEYFFEADLQAGPAGLKKLRELKYDFFQLTEKDFYHIFLQKKQKPFLSWLKRFTS